MVSIQCEVGSGAAKRSEVTAFTCVPTHCLTITLTTYCIFFWLLYTCWHRECACRSLTCVDWLTHNRQHHVVLPYEVRAVLYIYNYTICTHTSYIHLYYTTHYTYTVYIKQYHLVISHKVRAPYSVVTLPGVNITINGSGEVYTCTLNNQTVNIISGQTVQLTGDMLQIQTTKSTANV